MTRGIITVNIFSYLLLILLSLKTGMAQDKDTAQTETIDFELGEGVLFNPPDHPYQLKVSGFIQPKYTYSKPRNSSSDGRFNFQRAFFNISGNAFQEQLSFFFRWILANQKHSSMPGWPIDR